MDTNVPEFQLSLRLILPTAGVLALTILGLGVLLWKTRFIKVLSGQEALIGSLGEVRDPISEKRGKILVHGELWNAVSTTGESFAVGTVVVVTEVRDMLLVVQKKESL